MFAGINSNWVSFKHSSCKDNICVKEIGNCDKGLALKFKIESFLQFFIFSSIVLKSGIKHWQKNYRVSKYFCLGICLTISANI